MINCKKKKKMQAVDVAVLGVSFSLIIDNCTTNAFPGNHCIVEDTDAGMCTIAAHKN